MPKLSIKAIHYGRYNGSKYRKAIKGLLNKIITSFVTPEGPKTQTHKSGMD